MKSGPKTIYAEACGITPQQLTAWMKEDMPGPPKCIDPEMGNEWIRKNKSQRTRAQERKPAPVVDIKVEDSGDSWESRVIRAKQTEQPNKRKNPKYAKSE